MYRYKLFDGFEWYDLDFTEQRLTPAEAEALAEDETKDWDYNGISQQLDIYESTDEDEYGTLIGSVDTPGRRYQCRACLALFAHPPQELAVCRCGNVATHDDLEEE